MAYGTMGGDGQPQSQAAVFTRHVSSASRSSARSTRRAGCSGRTWGSTITNLRMENRFDGNLVDRLMSAGHDVAVLDEAYSDTMGHAGAVVLHPDGTLEGGHDPRADGGAAGRAKHHRRRRQQRNTVTVTFAPQSMVRCARMTALRILLALAAVLVAAPARAHPHIWVTMHSELVYAPDGSVTGIRQHWAFDDMFSAFAMQGLESQGQGRLQPRRARAARQDQCRVAQGIRLLHLRHRRRQQGAARRPAAGLFRRLQGFGGHAALHAAVQDAGEGQAAEDRHLRCRPFSSISPSPRTSRSSLVGAPDGCKLDVVPPREMT